jgi:hypothetical protein
MPTLLWTLPLDAAARGLSLAREVNRLLVWTDSRLLYANRDGKCPAQLDCPAPIKAAAVSEDGLAVVVATADGRVSWLGPDFTTRWQRQLKGKPTAVAIDPLGLVAAVATKHGQIVCFHADGETAREAVCPRPARHLAFVPGAETLVAASDLGWVAAFDLATGDWRWRDSPVADIGTLAVAGVAEPILLACFSTGLRAYHQDGRPWGFPTPFPACRAAAVSFDAQLIVTLQIDGIITGWSLDHQARFTYRPEAGVMAMALSALGDTLYLAQSDQRVEALSLSSAA